MCSFFSIISGHRVLIMQNFDFNLVEETEQPLLERDRCKNHPNLVLRRQSSRNSILPSVFPVDSICQSPGSVLRYFYCSHLLWQLLHHLMTPQRKEDGCRSMRLSDRCANNICIVESYHHEIDDWVFFWGFWKRLSKTTTFVDRLRGPQGEWEDCVVSHYTTVLLPTHGDGENYANKLIHPKEFTGAAWAGYSWVGLFTWPNRKPEWIYEGNAPKHSSGLFSGANDTGS